MGLQKAAVKLLTQNIALKKGEKVVVVSDRKKCPVFDAVCEAVKSMDGSLTTKHITKDRTHGSSLPQLKHVFEQNDIIIGITDKSISHSPETRIARKQHGARVISMVGVGEDLFVKAMKADQNKIKAIGSKLSTKLRECEKVTIDTPSGTDIRVNTVKDNVGIDDGDSTYEGALNNVPYGEVAMVPIDKINGIIAIDFSRVNVEYKDNVKLVVEDSRIESWNNEKAEQFVNYLRKAGGEKALKVVELGLGINPEHKNPVDNIIHDEKIMGSAHIAFGGWGDKRPCKIHEDVILLKPTIYFDDKPVIDKEKMIL